MKQNISETVNKWLSEESQPKVRRVMAIKQNSPWYGMSDEEIEDSREFIRCYLNKEFELLLLIPVDPKESGFWFENDEEFKESAFNTYDFQKDRKPFDKYGYRMKKVLEQIKDMAILHSCISQQEGRKNIRDRFELVVKNEFRNPLLSIIERYQHTYDEERRADLRRKIANLSQHILECKMIWDKYSPWEDEPSH